MGLYKNSAPGSSSSLSLLTEAVPCCVFNPTFSRTKINKMQLTTIVVLACLVATVVASVNYETPVEDVLSLRDDVSAYESMYGEYENERSPRTKRGLLLLKKKLLLGALGLKAAKVGAVGAGIAGALALKGKAWSG
ncbi:unnamed protein product, partial [Iphiclides podalirius]